MIVTGCVARSIKQLDTINILSLKMLHNNNFLLHFGMLGIEERRDSFFIFSKNDYPLGVLTQGRERERDLSKTPLPHSVWLLRG